jgi:cytochrome oxidase assembly protein ShyY1
MLEEKQVETSEITRAEDGTVTLTGVTVPPPPPQDVTRLTNSKKANLSFVNLEDFANCMKCLTKIKSLLHGGNFSGFMVKGVKILHHYLPSPFKTY